LLIASTQARNSSAFDESSIQRYGSLIGVPNTVSLKATVRGALGAFSSMRISGAGADDAASGVPLFS
jgi:hypothetical protein